MQAASAGCSGAVCGIHDSKKAQTARAAGESTPESSCPCKALPGGKAFQTALRLSFCVKAKHIAGVIAQEICADADSTLDLRRHVDHSGTDYGFLPRTIGSGDRYGLFYFACIAQVQRYADFGGRPAGASSFPV